MSLRDAMAAINTEATPETMRRLVNEAIAHFVSSGDDSRQASLLDCVQSASLCLNHLDPDHQAEAMRAGFRLGVLLALFDRPIAVKVAQRDTMLRAKEAEEARRAERNRGFCIQAEALLAENCPKREIATIITNSGENKDHDDLSISQIRRILNREFWNTRQI